MSNINGVELGLFGEAVIGEINDTLEIAEGICKELWHDNHGECPLRKSVPEKEAVMCGYPERINHVFKNNCTYESCPLIRR